MAEPGHEEEPIQGSPDFTIGFQQAAVNKPTFAVGGAWGGPSPDGSTIVAHLFVEHGALPNYLTYDKEETEEGTRLDMASEQRVQRSDLTREVQASIVLTPEVALRIAAWLVENAQKALQQRGGQ